MALDLCFHDGCVRGKSHLLSIVEVYSVVGFAFEELHALFFQTRPQIRKSLAEELGEQQEGWPTIKTLLVRLALGSQGRQLQDRRRT